MSANQKALYKELLHHHVSTALQKPVMNKAGVKALATQALEHVHLLPERPSGRRATR